MEWLAKYIDIKKIPTNIIVLLWVISFLLLYLPSEMLAKLSLTEFKADYGKYFGIIFLITSGLLLMFFFTWIFNKINGNRLNNKYKANIKAAMNDLDLHEKAVLREFYIQGVNTLKVPIDNPVVSGLIAKRILYQVGQYGKMSSVGMLFSHSISKIAIDLITMELLDLPEGEPTEAEIEKIKEQRPQWVLKLESKWF